MISSHRVITCARLIAIVFLIGLLNLGHDAAAQSVAAPQPASPSSPATPTPTATPSTPQGTNATGQNGFMAQDLMTDDWGGMRKTLQDDGLTFSPTYIGEVMGNPSGGMSRGTIYEGLLNLPLDLDFDAMSGGTLKDLTLHVNAYEIHGQGLSAHFVGDFSNTSNIAFDNGLRLQELWVQKFLFDKTLSIKVGNIAIDTEFFQSASSSLFINGTLGILNILALNVPNVPVYPLASPGIRFQYQPIPQFYLLSGVFGMDNTSDPLTNNQNGTRFALNSGSGMLIMNEVGYLLNQGPNDKGLQGSYRLGSFVHTANYDTSASKADADLDLGPLKSGGTNFGIYGIIDQQIYSTDSRAISFFVRSGYAPSDVNFIDYYVDGGFNFTGFIPGRASDVAGLAIARSRVSHDFSNAEVAEGDGPSTAETVLEATYKAQMAPWWSIQPDLQYIVTPGGEPSVAHNAVVLGLRTTIAF